MTNLDFLKQDLEAHRTRRANLLDNKGGYFIRREGYPVKGVIASYDKIIADLEQEIAEIESKKAARKQPQTTKKTPKKKKAAK